MQVGVPVETCYPVTAHLRAEMLHLTIRLGKCHQIDDWKATTIDKFQSIVSLD